VRNFLALARQYPPERQQVKLNQIVQEAVELLAYPLRVDDVEVKLDLVPDLPVLWADPHQLHQVLVNLVTNAHQAMRETPPPRRLTLTTRFEPAHGRVSLEVTDTGPGIPPPVRARIFEPFFTTKPAGQGTGLGLSLCLGIIEEHRGTIQVVETSPGGGTTFRIELPVDPRTAAPEALEAEALPPVQGKSILVVDDEPEIAETLRDMLANDGHQVETAANGVIALSKLRERDYELVLSDLKMPELDGPGLYREIERSYPGLRRRVIFITGDALSPGTREFLANTEVHSVGKPFVLDEVRRVIRQALQSA
jgi:two-component system NtrC family sensor kinase